MKIENKRQHGEGVRESIRISTKTKITPKKYVSWKVTLEK